MGATTLIDHASFTALALLESSPLAHYVFQEGRIGKGVLVFSRNLTCLHGQIGARRTTGVKPAILQATAN